MSERCATTHETLRREGTIGGLALGAEPAASAKESGWLGGLADYHSDIDALNVSSVKV